MNTSPPRVKSKPPPQKYIDMVYVLDRSGSMITMGGSHKVQLLNFLGNQKEAGIISNNSIQISIITFDDKAETCIDQLNAKVLELPDNDTLNSWCEPRGATRLYDTVIEAVINQKKRIQKRKSSMPKMLRELDPVFERCIYVLTDGLDNTSQKTSQDMKTLVENERKNGLKTIFLAANQDAVKQAQNFGFDPKTALTIGSDAKTSAIGMNFANQMARNMSSDTSDDIHYEFSKLERTCSQPVSYEDSDLSTSPPPPPPYSPPPPLLSVNCTNYQLNVTDYQAQATPPPTPRTISSNSSSSPEPLSRIYPESRQINYIEK